MQPVLSTMTDDEVRRIIIPDDQAGFGALETPQGLLPLKALDVQARIDGLLAHVEVAQTFVNTLGVPLEATYIFPLPDRAAVTRFRMEVAGRVIEGTLKERGEARQDYEQALREGRRAAITEEDRAGVFTLRVGNLMPGEEAVIRLTLTELLPFDDGTATFRFPLVVAPRYIPGTPLPGPSVGTGTAPDTEAVPDASRITPPVLLPGFPNPVRLSLSVEVDPAGLPASDFRSSLHTVAVEDGHGRRHITLNPGERLDRDFILRYRLGEQAVRTSLVLHPDAGDGREGTFVLTALPPAERAQAQRPRDIVFVLDRSGSMSGWKMVAARRALARMIDTLTERDRFTVYAFDDVIETPSAFQGFGLVSATDRHRFRAVEFLAKVEARNGTELAQPLAQAVQQLGSQLAPRVDAHARSECATLPRERILVLITDGQVGNEDQILHALAPHVQGLRVFTLGIDQAVNAAFLKRLAGLGGGLCELVESEDRLDEVLEKVHRRIGTPVLTDLRLDPAGLEVDSRTVVPRRLPDLFPGAPLVLLGRYHGAAAGSVALHAHDAAGRPWSETVSATRSDNPAIAAAWARGQVRELEDRYVTHPGEQSKLEKQLVQTSLSFGVLCRFTAFVAVDVKEVVNADGTIHRVTQPVEPAAGWGMLGTNIDEKLVAGAMGGMMLCASRRLSPRMQSTPASCAPEDACVDSLLQEFPDAAGSMLTPSAAAPPRLRTWRKEKGILARLSRIFERSGPEESSAPVPPVDLTAYRQRALDLLELLNVPAGTDAAERLTRLGMLAVQLAALVEDLTSTGAAEGEVAGLEQLLRDLQALVTAARPAEADVDRLWTRAEAALQLFGGLAPAASGKRRKAFWK